MADHGTAHEEPQLAEPETPLWLTLLGGALFLGAAVYFVIPGEETAKQENGAEAPAAAKAEAPAAAKAAPPARAPGGDFVVRPVPGGH